MAKKKLSKYWSGRVTKESNALDLEKGVFTWNDPRNPYQSAMSMLNFYINRAGKNLLAERKRILEEAKIELKKLFG